MVQTKGLAKTLGAAVQPASRNPLRWFVFAVVIAANIMDLMDATIVNVAGPSIRAALGGSASTLQWLPAGYTLAFAVFLITGARLGDMFGRRRLFLVGSAGFTVMSAACSVAPSMAALIVFRVLQGSFGALMIPQGFGMLKEVFAEDEMNKVFGAFGPMMGLSILAAPILAGGLVEANLWGVGWRLVFLINVPVGIAAFAGAVRVLPRTVAHPGVRLDTGGMILIGVAIVAVGTVVLAVTVTGARAASTLDLAPGLFLIGVGAGSSIGQLFDFILAGVSMDEVGSASGVLEAVQQLSSALGVAVLGTIFFSAFDHHLPTHALAITAWACLAPIAITFLLVFKLPMHAREPQT